MRSCLSWREALLCDGCAMRIADTEVVFEGDRRRPGLHGPALRAPCLRRPGRDIRVLCKGGRIGTAARLLRRTGGRGGPGGPGGQQQVRA